MRSALWRGCRPSGPVLTTDDGPVDRQQDHRADDRADQPTQVEHVAVPDPKQLDEQEKADKRARQTQQDRHEKAPGNVARHERLGDESGKKAENYCSNHENLLPTQSTGMPCRIVFSVTTRGSTNCSR